MRGRVENFTRAPEKLVTGQERQKTRGVNDLPLNIKLEEFWNLSEFNVIGIIVEKKKEEHQEFTSEKCILITSKSECEKRIKFQIY